MSYQAIYTNKKDGIAHIWDENSGYSRIKIAPYAYRKKIGGKYTSIYGEQLEKVTKFNPYDASLLSSDIPLDTQVLIDAYGDSDEPSKHHRIVALDIEVNTIGGYPDMKTANQPITSITLYESTTKHYTCWILDENSEVENSEESEISIISCKDEELLLDKFLSKWEEITPTIVTGWNTNQFDMPYLFTRISRVLSEEDAERLSPIKVVYFNERKEQLTIAGVNCLDYFQMYKWYNTKKLPNYRLDTVGLEELKIGKINYDGSLNDLKRTDIKKFIEYNIHDVRIVVQLDSKLQYIDLVIAICHVCHVSYEEYRTSSKFLEGAILTYLKRNHLVAPNKSYDNDQEEFVFGEDDDDSDVGFTGAYVKEPIPGRYDWICSADINSLYPSVIMSLNISPETKLGKIPKWDVDLFLQKKLEKIEFNNSEYTPSEFEEFIKTNNYAVASNGVVYDQRKTGCIPEILKKWFTDRVEFKKLMRDADANNDSMMAAFWKRRQHVQKILLNSMYGVLGLKNFRLYDLDNAEAVTLTGQSIIKTSAKFINVRFNNRCKTTDVDYVKYIDTDSVFLDIQSLMLVESITKESEKEFAINTISESADRINDFYNVMMPRMFNSTNHRIKIVADVVASSMFFLAKKRYAMCKVYNMELNKDVNEMEVKGLDVVRSSFPKRFRELMKGVLEDILSGSDKAIVDSRILKFKNEMKNFPINEVAKNTSVRFTSSESAKKKINFDPPERIPFTFLDKCTAQCKATLAYNDVLKKFNLNETEPIMSGGKIKWVYLTNNNPLGLGGLAFKDDGKDPKMVMDYINLYADRNKIWNMELQTKFTDFYAALRWPMFSVDEQKISEFFLF